MLVTARALNLPDLTCGATAITLANISCVSPAIKALIAGPTPLYGTCTILTPAMSLNNSPER